ncbi:MAG: ATP-binding protein [Ignavibacteriales bacterium]
MIAEIGKQYYTYARYAVVGIPVAWLLWHDFLDWWTAPWPDRWGMNLGKAMEQFEYEYAQYQAQLQYSSGKGGVKPAASRRSNSAGQRRRNLKAFDSLIGVDEAVEAIKDALEIPILSPKIVSKYKLKPAKGILLYGPPGTGKTSLARATAAYFGCAFDCINANDFMISLVGDSERALREKFEWARQNRPSVLFFDEFDAIGRRRDGMHLNRPSDLTINVLLAEMDGFESSDGVFVIAATNTVELLDPALVRPGRFDRQISIPLPDDEARKRLFELYLQRAGRPLAGAIDFVGLAAKTRGLSPAAIAQICEDAARKAAKRELGGGGAGIRMSDVVVSPTKAGTIVTADASSQTPAADKVGGGF